MAGTHIQSDMTVYGMSCYTGVLLDPCTIGLAYSTKSSINTGQAPEIIKVYLLALFYFQKCIWRGGPERFWGIPTTTIQYC